MKKVKIKEFLIMFAIQVTSYSLLCINFRAVAQAHYFWASISEFKSQQEQAIYKMKISTLTQ